MDLDETQRTPGQVSFSAAFFGWLVATAVGSLLTALLSAAGVAVVLTRGVAAVSMAHARTLGFAAALLWLVALAVAYLAGGYVAGRMARFDGARQGVGVWMLSLVIIVVLGIIGAIFGSAYNLVQQLSLPHIPISQGALTGGGMLALILSLAVSLGAAIAGGRAGEAYHRGIDRLTAPGPAPSEPAVRDRYQEQGLPTFGERLGEPREYDDTDR